MTTVARIPDLVGPRARRLRGPFLTAAAVGTASLALVVRDPHRHGSWGLCPFKAITGWDCPACGGLRAVNDLGHGQLVEAAHSNLLFVASLPLVLGLWALWVRRGWTGGAPPRLAPGTARALVLGATLVMLAFTIYRNTPWGSGWYAA
jgi:hypothetical protein